MRSPMSKRRIPWPGPSRRACPESRRRSAFIVRNVLVRRDDQTFAERCHLADPGFFRVFSFPLVRGDSGRGRCADLRSVGSHRSVGAQAFRPRRPVGTSADHQGRRPLPRFHGLGRSPPTRPANSSVRFGFVIPFDNVREYLNARSLHPMAERLLRDLCPARPAPSGCGASIAALSRSSASAIRQDYAAYVTVRLQPLTDIHLAPTSRRGFEPTGDPLYSLRAHDHRRPDHGGRLRQFHDARRRAVGRAGPARSACARRWEPDQAASSGSSSAKPCC